MVAKTSSTTATKHQILFTVFFGYRTMSSLVKKVWCGIINYVRTVLLHCITQTTQIPKILPD